MRTLQDQSKVETFFEEFPYLHRFASPDAIRTVGVKRWDKDLLDMYHTHYVAGAELDVYLVSPHVIRFLDENWETVAIANERPEYRKIWWNPLTWLREPPVETVFGSIQRLGENARRVTLIVVVTGTTLVVCKPPRGTKNLREWMDESMRKEKGVVRTALAAAE
ncbi:MAG TPA: hypothetical protein VFY28_01105 [Candidatus Paceibacterota bacterium]|nr:hypothetical protein [Candidatus Paceibacterota bacterium]